MLIYCQNCDRPLRTGEKVRAVVVAEYKELASKKTYAFTKPEECIDIEHLDCGEALKDD